MRLTKMKMIKLSARLSREEMEQLILLNQLQYSRLQNHSERLVSVATNDQFITTFVEVFMFLIKPILLGPYTWSVH